MWMIWLKMRSFFLRMKNDLTQFKKQAFKAAHQFSIETILPKYEEMYERVIKNGF